MLVCYAPLLLLLLGLLLLLRLATATATATADTVTAAATAATATAIEVTWHRCAADSPLSAKALRFALSISSPAYRKCSSDRNLKWSACRRVGVQD